MFPFSKQTLNVVSISLVLISALLILNLFDVQFPNFGYAIQDSLDTENASCFATFQSQTSQINLNTCCHEARKQLNCNKETKIIDGVETDILCSTSQTTISYQLTNKAYRYCINTFS